MRENFLEASADPNFWGIWYHTMTEIEVRLVTQVWEWCVVTLSGTPLHIAQMRHTVCLRYMLHCQMPSYCANINVKALKAVQGSLISVKYIKTK